MAEIIKAKKFTIHSIKCNIQDIYIAEYDDKILILDGGSRGDERLIEDYIKDNCKCSISDVKLMVATHIHPDHSAAAVPLRKKYGIQIASHPDVDKWYGGFTGLLQFFADIFFSHLTNTLTGKPLKRFWFKRKIKPDHLLDDRDHVPFFDDWEVLHTPGHTTNDIVLYNQKESILYAADLVLKLNNKFNLPFHVTIPELMKQSLQKAAQLPVKTVLLAHGGMITDTDSTEMFLSVIDNINKKMQFGFQILKPLTRLTGEIRRVKKKYNLK